MPESRPWAGLPRFFGRRHGKPLKPTAAALLELLLPELAIPIPTAGERIDPAHLFASSPQALWLEVGFGGGEHLAWQAARNPQVGIIGAEVFVNGIASLLRHVRQGGLANVRIFAEDVRKLLPALPDACFERIFVLFPDPWPKKRHAERRFIGGTNLDQLARLLTDGGRLRIATDDPTYQAWAQEQMGQRRDFRRIAADPSVRPDDWPPTRYETKARSAGRVPIFLEYLRLARSVDGALEAKKACSSDPLGYSGA